MQKIIPFLTFNDQAEAAANFYVSIFKNSKIGTVTHYGEAAPGSTGNVMSVTFQLEGQDFYALNGGPHFTFAPGISLYVDCKTQAEVDALWDKLSAGGEKQPCGWLKDQFGVSWQIIPSALGEMMSDPDPAKAQRVIQAMLQMTKIDIQALKDARDRA